MRAPPTLNSRIVTLMAPVNAEEMILASLNTRWRGYLR